MGALRGTPTPAVLRNRGVPVAVHVVEAETATRFRRTFDADTGEPVQETRHVALTAWTLARIEEKWGDMDGWQKAAVDKPYLTAVETLALVWDMPTPAVGTMLLDGALEDYNTALAGAFMLANGADGDAVVRVLTAAEKVGVATRAAVADEAAKIATEMDEAMVELDRAMAADTPGTSGSEPGSIEDAVTTSSGT